MASYACGFQFREGRQSGVSGILTSFFTRADPSHRDQVPIQSILSLTTMTEMCNFSRRAVRLRGLEQKKAGLRPVPVNIASGHHCPPIFQLLGASLDPFRYYNVLI